MDKRAGIGCNGRLLAEENTMERREGRIRHGDIDLYYEDWGQREDPALLLIMGLSGQLIHWPEALVRQLVERGLRVIPFDHRDIGLSSALPSSGRYHLPRAMLRASFGLAVDAPYTLDDLAADCLALLDGLGIARAHIAGISMGGMIAQILAADHPERVASVSIMMSSPLMPGLVPPSPRMLWTLFSGGFGGRKPKGLARPRPQDIADFLQRLSGRQHRSPHDHLVSVAQQALARAYRPAGVMRQMLAILATGDLRPRLHKIRAPALVMHGRDDPLLPWWGGWIIARHIRGAQWRLVPGWGHDLPESMHAELVQRIGALTGTAG